jgi:hypothetical protein
MPSFRGALFPAQSSLKTTREDLDRDHGIKGFDLRICRTSGRGKSPASIVWGTDVEDGTFW